MSRSGFSYAQSRLHARLASRLTDSDWQRLEASRDLAHCLDAAGRTRARVYSERLDRNSGPHAIERVMREGWMAHVGEIARWVPQPWRAATRWLAVLPYLRWYAADPDAESRPGWLTPEPEIAIPRAMTSRADNAATLPDHWMPDWERAIPAASVRRSAPEVLAPALARFLSRDEVPVPHRAVSAAELPVFLVAAFRAWSQTPISVFSFILLSALDMERLRGLLLNRALFGGRA